MAVVPMQKVTLLVHRADKARVVDFLQKKGVLQLTELSHKEKEAMPVQPARNGRDLELSVAELAFAIDFLKPYEKRSKGINAFLTGDHIDISWSKLESKVRHYSFQTVVDRCKKIDESLLELMNESRTIAERRATLTPWKRLHIKLEEPSATEHAARYLVLVDQKRADAFIARLQALSPFLHVDRVSATATEACLALYVGRDFENKVFGLLSEEKAELVTLPEGKGTIDQELKRMREREQVIAKRISQLKEAATKLSPDLPLLRMAYDYTSWDLARKQAHRSFLFTDSAVAMGGWMPAQALQPIRAELSGLTSFFELLPSEPEPGESPPVLLKNRGFFRPFQAVTDIYGLPLPNELDPTPYLAVFFIVYFGLCLTDAVYGILMFALTWSALKYLNLPPSSRPLVRLLMYGGLITFVIGTLFGGWAAFLPEQVPSWLTTINAQGETVFIGQKISALSNPLGVLILSLVLGFLQTWVGVFMKFVWLFKSSKRQAFLDAFPWSYLLTIIALMLMLQAGLIPETASRTITYLLYIGVGLIVLTQGREKKNIIAKFLSGVLALYSLVGYLSDVLSYSRLLALGLATSIIGMAVNTITGLTAGIPLIGYLLAAVVFIGGHLFNIGINALGSFIHSGRLQFVEFFSKFMEGGGVPFKPLSTQGKYVRLTAHS